MFSSYNQDFYWVKENNFFCGVIGQTAKWLGPFAINQKTRLMNAVPIWLLIVKQYFEELQLQFDMTNALNTLPRQWK